MPVCFCSTQYEQIYLTTKSKASTAKPNATGRTSLTRPATSSQRSKKNHLLVELVHDGVPRVDLHAARPPHEAHLSTVGHGLRLHDALHVGAVSVRSRHDDSGASLHTLADRNLRVPQKINNARERWPISVRQTRHLSSASSGWVAGEQRG